MDLVAFFCDVVELCLFVGPEARLLPLLQWEVVSNIPLLYCFGFLGLLVVAADHDPRYPSSIFDMINLLFYYYYSTVPCGSLELLLAEIANGL